VRGFADATLSAFRIPGSGVCALEAGRYTLVGSYTIERSPGTAAQPDGTAIHVDTRACEALEDSHGPLSGVLVRVKSGQPIAVPLEGGTATLGAPTATRSIALLAPIEPRSQTPWVETLERGTLVLNIEVNSNVDLVFVFEDAAAKVTNAPLRVAGVEIPFATEGAPLTVETRKHWLSRDSRVVESKRKCGSDVQLSASGNSYHFGKDSTLEWVAGDPVVWWPG
jgi:hypothetical protein